MKCYRLESRNTGIQVQTRYGRRNRGVCHDRLLEVVHEALTLPCLP